MKSPSSNILLYDLLSDPHAYLINLISITVKYTIVQTLFQ